MQKCIFFVVPGDRGALLDMPGIEPLNILQINCNTIGTKKEEKGVNSRRIKETHSVLEVSSAKQT